MSTEIDYLPDGIWEEEDTNGRTHFVARCRSCGRNFVWDWELPDDPYYVLCFGSDRCLP